MPTGLGIDIDALSTMPGAVKTRPKPSRIVGDARPSDSKAFGIEPRALGNELDALGIEPGAPGRRSKAPNGELYGLGLYRPTSERKALDSEHLRKAR